MRTTTISTEVVSLPRILQAVKSATYVTTIRIPVDPVPASRPRVGKYGSYYAKPYLNWRDAAQEHLSEGHTNLKGPLLLVVEQVKKAPKSSRLSHPKPDIDNFVKAPMDAITKIGGWWDDDFQVVYLLTNKRWAQYGEEPHTNVEIYTIEEDTRP